MTSSVTLAERTDFSSLLNNVYIQQNQFQFKDLQVFVWRMQCSPSNRLRAGSRQANSVSLTHAPLVELNSTTFIQNFLNPSL